MVRNPVVSRRRPRNLTFQPSQHSNLGATFAVGPMRAEQITSGQATFLALVFVAGWFLAE